MAYYSTRLSKSNRKLFRGKQALLSHKQLSKCQTKHTNLFKRRSLWTHYSFWSYRSFLYTALKALNAELFPPPRIFPIKSLFWGCVLIYTCVAVQVIIAAPSLNYTAYMHIYNLQRSVVWKTRLLEKMLSALTLIWTHQAVRSLNGHMPTHSSVIQTETGKLVGFVFSFFSVALMNTQQRIGSNMVILGQLLASFKP